MQSVFFRRAKQNELLRVKHISRLAYQIPFRDGALITKTNEPRDIQKSFLKKEFAVIVAERAGKIVGALRYRIDTKKNELYFYKLAVLKRYRNHGIGSGLVREVEKVATKKKCTKVLLYCIREKKLSGYYKKLGYKIEFTKKQSDHHEVHMSKIIHLR